MKKIIACIVLLMIFNFNLNGCCDTYSKEDDKKNAEILEELLIEANYYNLSTGEYVKEKENLEKKISEEKAFAESIQGVDLKEYALYFLNYFKTFFQDNLNKKEFKIFNHTFNKRKNNIDVIIEVMYELRRLKFDIDLAGIGF